MRMKACVLNLAVFWLLVPAAFAQQGPEVPCQDCPEFSMMPRPETGIWRNPQQSGTGFMLEIQNDSLGGFYFLFDEDGAPIWFLIAGTLEPGEEGEAIWILEAELQELADGSCLNCPFQAPDATGSAGSIRFEFMDRNFGRFSVDGGPAQNILPLTFGVSGLAEFAQLSDYVLPDLSGEWVFHWENPPFARPGMDEMILSRADSEDPEAPVRYDILILSGGDILVPNGTVVCSGSADFGPLCEIELDEVDTFRGGLASFGDGRLVAESEAGLRLTAFRLNYD